MADSTAPAAKAAILSLLNASTDLTGVAISWAAPTKEDEYTEDMVWLGDVDQEEEYKALGNQRKDEAYDLEITVQAYVPGDDPQSTEERGWEIRQAVVDLIRADLTLGGILNQWAEVTRTRMTTRPASPSGWLCKGTLQLHCRARI